MIYYTILYYTILYYTIIYYTILYYTILYYTMISRTPSGAIGGKKVIGCFRGRDQLNFRDELMRIRDLCMYIYIYIYTINIIARKQCHV